MRKDFARGVFINCPFDDQYIPILRAVVFCVLYLGLNPRIALERLNSGETRFDKIVQLVGECRYAIHDLSRLRATEAGEYYRLNMPFELGLDVGCRLFRQKPWSGKKCLILEAEKYRFQAALSDLSNSDIAVHGNDPRRALAEVRSWLVVEASMGDRPGATAIWSAFTDFNADHYDVLIERGHSPDDVKALPMGELIPAMRAWVARRRAG